MGKKYLYEERATSSLTEALFIALTLAFSALYLWWNRTGGVNILSAIFLGLAVFFLLYAVNYRVLYIRLTPEALKLHFGIIRWAVPLVNIVSCKLDQIPAFYRYGGAGVHFMMVRGRYRASFNFLEGPRLVIALKQKAGWVKDLSFSTRQPEELIRLIETRIGGNRNELAS